MDSDNPVELCIAATRAEFARRRNQALALALRAWEAASDEYEACIAAHYVARYQENLCEALHWNQEALTCAESAARAGDERVRPFYPSLYLNLGRAYELLGNQSEAQRYYDLAAELGVSHQGESACENDGGAF